MQESQHSQRSQQGQQMRNVCPLDSHAHSLSVLITGSSQGIGRATVQRFLAAGHQVYGIDILPSSINHQHYCHVQADVRDGAALPQDIEPEVIVCSAGVQNSGDDIGINLQGTINVCEKYAFSQQACCEKTTTPSPATSDAQSLHAGTPDSGISSPELTFGVTPAPKLKSIVLIGSSSGHTGAEFPAYTASKGGILSYTKNLAQRLAPQAICNSVDPGGVLTELNRPVMDDEKLWNRIMDLTPLRRWATPEEIAEWVYFVGVTNRFMTGQNLLIDGGEAGNFDFVWPA